MLLDMRCDMPTLMNRDAEVLQYDLTRGTVSTVAMLRPELAPEQLKGGQPGALERWFSERSVDLNRTNARLLVKGFRLSGSKAEIVMANRALSLTDTWWIREQEAETFAQLCLHRRETDRLVMMTALSGEQAPLLRQLSPELTNIGSFNKAWFRENGVWWLVKAGSPKTIYAELFTNRLGCRLGLNMAHVEYRKPWLYSRNFTSEDRILEHYASFRYRFDQVRADEGTIFQNLQTLGLHQPYLDMLLLDAIVNNGDRHEFNHGVLKDPATGKVLGLAPNFDNNLALGGITAPSTVQLRMHLEEFGVRDWQREWLRGVTMECLMEVDREVRPLIDPEDLTESSIEVYFRSLLHLIDPFTD